MSSDIVHSLRRNNTRIYTDSNSQPKYHQPSSPIAQKEGIMPKNITPVVYISLLYWLERGWLPLLRQEGRSAGVFLPPVNGNATPVV